ncbi:hypothetical protein Droror1_Dr00028117 [Drosera rotundifolia]
MVRWYILMCDLGSEVPSNLVKYGILKPSGSVAFGKRSKILGVQINLALTGGADFFLETLYVSELSSEGIYLLFEQNLCWGKHLWWYGSVPVQTAGGTIDCLHE